MTAPDDRPLTGTELTIAGLLFTLAMLVTIFAASTPRSAATAIPAGNQSDLPSSGNLSLPSEAPRSGLPVASADAASGVAPALVGEVGASSSPATVTIVTTRSPAAQP
jgi:hypothetical protein